MFLLNSTSVDAGAIIGVLLAHDIYVEKALGKVEPTYAKLDVKL